MPKDLTKASLKDFENLQGGDEQRFRWTKGRLELLVQRAEEDQDDLDA
jgi:hypothetical protein